MLSGAQMASIAEQRAFRNLLLIFLDHRQALEVKLERFRQWATVADHRRENLENELK